MAGRDTFCDSTPGCHVQPGWTPLGGSTLRRAERGTSGCRRRGPASAASAPTARRTEASRRDPGGCRSEGGRRQDRFVRREPFQQKKENFLIDLRRQA